MELEIIDVGKIVAAVLVISEVVKRAGLKSRYVPLLAILLGLGGAFLLDGVNWVNTFIGIVLGLGTTLTYREVGKAVKKE